MREALSGDYAVLLYSCKCMMYGALARLNGPALDPGC
jgi:hypothetical protein